MNTKIYRLMVLLLVAAVVIVAPLSAEAAGTASGTSITNNATVNYEVSGVPQTPLSTGPTATFVVDNKVNLTVTTTNIAYVSTAPSSTSQVQTFRVKNTGNTTQDYSLAAVNATDPFGGADNFDATNVQVFVETNGTPGYQAGADTATIIDELVSDATATVYIVADIPAGRATNDIAAYALVATTHNGGAGGSLGALTTATAGANNLLVVDVVFADAANANVPTDTLYDGEASDRSAYRVTGAALTITKTAVVYSDPFNLLANPKMIPGAVITYTITVTNGAAGSPATNVAITDSLNAEIIAGRLAFNTTFVDGANTCVGLQGIVVNTVCKTNTNDADGADFGLSAANTVTVNGLTINLSSSAVIKFQVVVQ
jgi:hypothetical protein